MREGISEAAVEAIGSGQQPVFALADEHAVYDFSVQSLVDKQANDATWSALTAPLGEHGAVDFLGIVGCHSMLALMLNGARPPVPVGAPMPLPAL